VYVREAGDDWLKISRMQAYSMSVFEKALWIVDYDSYMPFKYDHFRKRFRQKGSHKAKAIQAGPNGRAIIKDWDRRVVGWHYGEWKALRGARREVVSVASGRGGRLYWVDYNSYKVYG